MIIELDPELAKKLIIENPSVQFTAKPDYVSMIITFEGKEKEYKLSPSYARSLGCHIVNLSLESEIKSAHLRARSLPPSFSAAPRRQSLSLWNRMKSWLQ